MLKQKRPEEKLWLIELIQFDLCTGLRLGELINLRWNDILMHDEPQQNGDIVEYGWLTVSSTEGDAAGVCGVMPSGKQAINQREAQDGID